MRTMRVALGVGALTAALAGPWAAGAQAPEPAKGVRFASISPADLKEWLTYISSDEMQGRQVFTEGYGAAAEYVAERLRQFGVKPIGEHGSYFQIVKLRSYRVTRHSAVTVEVNGQTRVFKDGEHVNFPATAGGRQTVTFVGAEFVGGAQAADYGNLNVSGKLVLSFAGSGGRGGGGRGRAGYAFQTAHAGAFVSYLAPVPATAAADEAVARAQEQLTQAQAAYAAAVAQRAGGRGAGVLPGRGRAAAAPADIPATTTRVDAVVPPQFTADDTFYDFVLSGGPAKFTDLKDKAARNEPLAPFSVPGVRITVSVDNTYDALTTQLTRNVVGQVDGTDAQLKGTYVLFGAHLDHVGYATSDQDIKGRVNNPISEDKIWNGADDDGTGTTAELAIAKAFATGPKPKRSVVFVWHAGEEADLYGSRYNADFPIVPLQQIQCQLNIDMIGRNRDNDPAQANTVFVIGDDRISTDLHNAIVDTNATLASPLRLDYEYNDPTDPNSFYTRSDHYSYAAKGIPIAFFFTGTHPDYHANSDSVEKILFDKQAHVAQLVYQTGFAIANSERTLIRDNKGPRAGRGFTGRLER